MTHHKTLPSDGIAMYGCLPDEQIPFTDHVYPVWNQMAEQWNQNMEELREEWIKICKAINREDLLAKPLKLVVPLSDTIRNWLDRGSQVRFIPFKQRYYVSLQRGLLISADHIMSAGNIVPRKIPPLKEYNITSHSLYEFQIKAGKKLGNLILGLQLVLVNRSSL